MYSSFNARAIGLTGLDPVTTIDLAARFGFEGVDLMVRDIVDSGVDPAQLRSRMDDLGLKAGAFPCPIDWRGDDASYQSGLSRLPSILAAARVLGLKRTGTWVMPRIPEDERTRADIARFHLDRLGSIARILADDEVNLGLEVIGVESFAPAGGQSFVARLEDLDDQLGGIWEQSPNLGIVLDCFHLYAAGESIDAGLAWGVGKIVWVHVADLPRGADADRKRIIDANRGLPGDHGAVKVAEFLERLSLEGYEGPVTVEPLGNCQSLVGLPVAAQVERVKRSLDQVWP